MLKEYREEKQEKSHIRISHPTTISHATTCENAHSRAPAGRANQKLVYQKINNAHRSYPSPQTSLGLNTHESKANGRERQSILMCQTNNMKNPRTKIKVNQRSEFVSPSQTKPCHANVRN